MAGSQDEYDPEIRAVADEIARHLREHGSVADTLDGIAQWWLMQQRVREENKKVERAMDYLCDQGLVEKRVLQSGEVLYSARAKTPSDTDNKTEH